MIVNRKISRINIFAGSPWEVASVKSLLTAAAIQADTRDNGSTHIFLSVPCEYYTAVMRIIGHRIAF